MKKRLLLIATAVAIITTAFGCGKNEDPKEEAGDTSAVEEYSIPEDSATELTKSEIKEIEDTLNTCEYYGYLDQGFDSPESIEWEPVFYDGAGITTGLSDEEEKALLKELQWDELYGDAFAISKSDMENYIKEHAGIDVDVTELDLGGTYLPEYDKFYFTHSDSNYVPYKCTGGIKSGNDYEVELEYDDSLNGEDRIKHKRTLSFTDNDGVYQIHFNNIDWEDGSDPDQSFEFELGNGEKAMLYTYEGSSSDESALIIVVKNGKFMCANYTCRDWGDDRWNMDKVEAIGFVDYNLDGYNDMIVIGKGDTGEKILVYRFIDDDIYSARYLLQDNLGEYAQSKISDYTISNVKDCLVGEYEKSSKDWKAAYSQLVRIYDLLYGESEYSYTGFDLIDLDGDEMKELVVDHRGYYVSIFTYKNNQVQCIMDEWGYGAGGNAGYDYAPGKNRLMNYNADYAGAIGNEYYMTVKDGEIVTDYWVTYYNFDDVNGNGEPDEEELTDDALTNCEGKVIYHADDKSLSESDIRSRLVEIDSYKYEPLSGEKTKDEILLLLQ